MNWYNNLFGGVQGIANNTQASYGQQNQQGITSGQALQQLNQSAQSFSGQYQAVMQQQILGPIQAFFI